MVFQLKKIHLKKVFTFQLVLDVVTHKELGLAHLIVLLSGPGLGHDELGCLLDVCLLGPVQEHLVAEDKVLVGNADGVTSTADADGFEHTRVTQLGEHKVNVKLIGRLVLVGLDATNKVRIAVGHVGDEIGERVLHVGRTKLEFCSSF